MDQSFATLKFIHDWNETYLRLSPSRRAIDISLSISRRSGTATSSILATSGYYIWLSSTNRRNCKSQWGFESKYCLIYNVLLYYLPEKLAKRHIACASTSSTSTSYTCTHTAPRWRRYPRLFRPLPVPYISVAPPGFCNRGEWGMGL